MDFPKTITQVSKPLQDFFTKFVDPVLQSPILSLLLSYLVVLNIIYSTDVIPKQLLFVLKNDIYKVVITFLSVYSVTGNVLSSFILVLALFIVYYILKKFTENFELISPDTDSMPGCVDIKVSDLLALFDGDEEKLKKAMYTSRVPLDVHLDDINAPLIATYLVNFGYKISDKCRPPH